MARQGTSIPIVWTCLDKSGGNSNSEERIVIMERVLKLIPVSNYHVDFGNYVSLTKDTVIAIYSTMRALLRAIANQASIYKTSAYANTEHMEAIMKGIQQMGVPPKMDARLTGMP